MTKKTVIVGATPNQSRYAYLAAKMLTEYGHEIVPLGIRQGEVFGREIMDIRKKPVIEGVDTITIYLSPVHQDEWMDYLLKLNQRGLFSIPVLRTKHLNEPLRIME